MEIKRIGYWKAALSGHPLSPYVDEDNTYFTRRQYNAICSYMESAEAERTRLSGQIAAGEDAFARRVAEHEALKTHSGDEIKQLGNSLATLRTAMQRREEAARNERVGIQGEINYHKRLLDQQEDRIKHERRINESLRHELDKSGSAASEMAGQARELQDQLGGKMSEAERLRHELYTACEELRMTIDVVHGYYTEQVRMVRAIYDANAIVEMYASYVARFDEDIKDYRKRWDGALLEISNLNDIRSRFNFLMDLSSRYRTIASNFLRAAIPQPRNGEPVIFDGDHHKSRDSTAFVEKVSRVPYVTRIKIRLEKPTTTRILGIGEDHGKYFVELVYANGNRFGTHLSLNTTAENPIQAAFVEACIRELIK